MAKTALLIIDAQVGLLDGAHQAEVALDAIAEALARARRAGAPVAFLRHNHASFAPLMQGAPTWEIHPRPAPLAGEAVIDKTASDGFWNTERPLSGSLMMSATGAVRPEGTSRFQLECDFPRNER